MNPNGATNIGVGDTASFSGVNFAETSDATILMTGGTLTSGGMNFFGLNHTFTFNQSGGIYTHTGTGWFIMNQSHPNWQRTDTWSLSGDARSYISVTGGPAFSFGKGTLAKISISENALFYSNLTQIGDVWYESPWPSGKGIFEQKGGEAYFGTLRLSTRREGDYQATGANMYQLEEGTLAVHSVTLNPTMATTSGTILQPQILLQGGVATIGTSAISLTNEGSTIEIQGGLEILDNFSAANVRPTFTEWGRMTVDGDFTQTAGALVMDVNYVEGILTENDFLDVTGNFLVAGGDLLLQVDGMELEEGFSIAATNLFSKLWEGAFDQIYSVGKNGNWFWSLQDGNLVVAGNPEGVPEPSSWILMGLVFLGYVGFQYRKRGKK
ncbi:MAG: PEP-CTERM sorting domain-containing protein [Planctomycetia bacterium]|nr:PEP-CTERM sorting domain-containing protein [Planctomycetia bacterium]